MKKILFALKDMNVGGVEKALLSLLNEMNRQEYKVMVLLLQNSGGFLNQIPEDVEVKILEGYADIEGIVNNPPLHEIKSLCQKKKVTKALKLSLGYIWYKMSGNMVLYYKIAFSDIQPIKEEYDIAISFTSIISYLTYYVKYKVKAPIKIGWIHFDVNKLVLDKKTVYNLHKNFNKIFVVSKEAYENFIKMFPKLENKCEVKYNIVSENYINQMSKEVIEDVLFDCDYEGISIFTLGRLSREKGQDIIPEVALKLKEADIDFKWYLIGEGNLRCELETEIDKKGLVENIILLGAKTNPYPYLKKADIYVQTSVYEGFCISLAEAKTLRLPIVSTEFVGAKEQLSHYKNGIIVRRNVEEIYKSIVKLKDHSCKDIY